MAQQSFLDKIAAILLADYSNQLNQTIVVLPNKRARIFLIESLRKATDKTIFSPQIISIEDLIQQIAQLRFTDNINLLFTFYDVYLKVTDVANQQKFEQFGNWAKTLLQDFNEIDRYLLEPDKILKYLDDINDIKHWSVDAENRTTLIENHLNFWKQLPIYYHELYAHLLKSGIGYQGLVYREAVKKLDQFEKSLSNHQIIFAGFNALNAAEEKLFQHLLENGKAKVYWDADEAFINDSYHDAGLFLGRFKREWKYYQPNPFEWIGNDFSQPKHIEVIGTPKSIGQAKIAGYLIEQQLIDNPEQRLDKTAIILGEENLLLPLLRSLPSSVPALNITMGYTARNNPVQVLLAKIFKMHTHALSRSQSSYVFYYKDVLEVLTHPLVEPYAHTRKLSQRINSNNYSFISQHKLIELQEQPNSIFKLLFDKWDNGSLAALKSMSDLLLLIKSYLDPGQSQDKITKTFVYAIFKVINQLTDYFEKNTHVDSIDTLYAMYKQIIELAEVSFEGEPLDGLQVMGVLESRVLDFDTVIITSVNEGKFPAGKSQNSFIPYDVKREKGLPTFKEKDAIYTYHFYHLLQRAKKIYLIYNTESEGLDAGERSRFITQLEVEKQPAHELVQKIYSPELPESVNEPMVIPKSEQVMERLREIADTGFSPSALTSYIRNPIDFYFQKILRIREVEEVEENIALNTLGTIIHGTLEELYKPLIGKTLAIADVEELIKKADSVVLEQFKIVYKEGEIKKGRNLLAFEVAKRNVYNFLNLELEQLKFENSIQILYLEQRFERDLLHNDLPYPVKIGGSVDRIERFNGQIRIIDYKTGKVDKANVILKNWDGLTQDIKSDKMIQLLAYAFMFESWIPNESMQAGIISFKNMKSGFLPFTYKNSVAKTETSLIDAEILDNYQEQLAILLKEILDPNIPFTERRD